MQKISKYNYLTIFSYPIFLATNALVFWDMNAGLSRANATLLLSLAAAAAIIFLGVRAQRAGKRPARSWTTAVLPLAMAALIASSLYRLVYEAHVVELTTRFAIAIVGDAVAAAAVLIPALATLTSKNSGAM